MTTTKEVLKGALKGSLKGESDTKINNSKPVSEPNHDKKDKVGNIGSKRRVGRPTTIHKETKINAILEKRGMTRKDLYDEIIRKYPDEPISPDAVSRIVSGKRKYYSTNTVYRICGALGVTPNMILNWEQEVR